ncbi:MAG: tetratricopeptide repeat protein [Candidatus Eisenbacteria bacterium]|nr:tetratricopeptide repeat protein [Candidatus Eisenbacteria bacterium]
MAYGVFGAFLLLLFLVWVTVTSRRIRERAAPPDAAAYRRGIDAMVAGDRDAAVRHLAAAVRDDPRNVDAYVKLGNLLRERGQLRQATQIHRELLIKRRLPPTTKSEILRCYALDLAASGNWGEVLETLRSLPRSERGDPEALRLTRDAHENTGELDRAVHDHRELLRAATDAAQPPLGVYRAHTALLSLRQGDAARAKAELQAAVNESPEAVLAHAYLGDIARDEGDAGNAIAHWLKLVSERPECADLVFDRLEKAYYDAGDFGRMMRVYEDIVARSPANAPALIGLARMHERKGALDEAIRVAQEAVKHEGATLAGHRELLEMLARNGQHEEAARLAVALVRRLSDERGARKCASCGKRWTDAAWRCQHCGAWTHGC